MSAILSRVERAYALVLDKRWDFIPTIVENFNKLDLWHKLRIFTCGDGTHPDLNYDHIDVKELPRILPNSTDYPTWRNKCHAYNAFLCHQKILKEALSSGYEYILMTEDDAIIEDDFHEILNKVSPDLETKNWSMLYLGAFHFPGSTIPTANPNLFKINQAGGFHGVILRRDIIAELVYNFSDGIGPIDWICGKFLHSVYDCYCVYPSIISQRDNIHSYVEDCILKKPDRYSKG